MSGLRKIAVCYLVSVSAFGLAAGLRAWPDVADQATRLFDQQIWRPSAEALARADRALLDAPESKPRVVLALNPSPAAPSARPADERTFAHVDLLRIARPALAFSPEVQLALDTPIVIAPDLSPKPVIPQGQVRAAPKPAPQIAQLPPAPDKTLTPEQTRVRARLAATLTTDMRSVLLWAIGIPLPIIIIIWLLTGHA